MTEQHHGEISSQHSIRSRLLQGRQPNAENPYADVQRDLITHLGGDWLPRHNRFQAVKKRLRIEQAVVKHRKVLGTDPQPTRDAASGNVFDAAWHVLGSNEATENVMFAPGYTLALFRAAITIDGDKEEQKRDAGEIFDKYLGVAKQVTSPTGDSDFDEANYHAVATRALAKDMRPLVTTDWVLFLINLLKVKDE
jgi:hypothetical protein